MTRPLSVTSASTIRMRVRSRTVVRLSAHTTSSTCDTTREPAASVRPVLSVHHPVAASAYYEEQKPDAAARAARRGTPSAPRCRRPGWPPTGHPW